VTRDVLTLLRVESAGLTICPQTVRPVDRVNAEWPSRYRVETSQPNRRSTTVRGKRG
jgi:hypothetical protein